MTVALAHHAQPQFQPRRHLKVTGASPAFGFEPCEDIGCTVGMDGKTSSCGRHACAVCGCSGTNLSTIHLAESPARIRLSCTCGHSWVREATSGSFRPRVLTHD